MEQTKRDFATILEEAQALGYAEADPTFDVDGIDSAHKLAILASLAFGTKIDFNHVHVEGIRNITPVDISFADELGYRIKLLGIGMLSDNSIEQRVHPCLVSKESSIAKVSGVNNAVAARGDMVGDVVFEGPGAGELATASSVVADIVDVALKRSDEPFGVPLMQLDEKPTIDIQQRNGCYYLRVTVADEAGVLASVSDVFKEHDVSLETILQRPLLEGKSSIVAVTHAVKEQVITKALEKIQKLDSVVNTPQMIRIEQ
jgi:homoserine dehydrogenase